MIGSWKRPRILLVPDQKNWAFDFLADEIVRFGSNRFRFTKICQGDLEEGADYGKFDAIYFFWWGERSLEFAHRAGIPRSRAMTVVSSWKSWQRRGWNARRLGDYLRSYVAVGAVSKELLAELEPTHPSVFLTRHGVDPGKFHRQPPIPDRRPGGKLVVGWVGSLRHAELKGFPNVVDPAVRAVEGVELRLALDPDSEHEAGRFYRRDEMKNFYSEVDLLVSASASEGAGLGLLEAGACGRPVVTTRTGLAPELVEQGKTGVLIERTVEDLAATLRRLRDDRAALQRMGDELASTIEREWTWPSRIREYEAMFDEVVARSREQRKQARRGRPGTAAKSGRPRSSVAHVMSYDFDPACHPAVHRTITSLAPHLGPVVITAGKSGYRSGPVRLTDEDPDRSFVHLLQLHKLQYPHYARYLASGLRARYGRIEAVIAHYGNNGWRSLQLARALDVPIMTIFGGTDANVATEGKYSGHFAQLRVAPGAYFVGVAPNICRRLVEFGVAESQTRVHHRGLDLDRFSPRTGAGEEPLRVVMAGRLIPVKGYAMAIRGFARFRRSHTEATFDIFGDGPLEAELKELAGECGVGEAVRFHGRVTSSHLHREMRDAAILLQTSVRDDEGQTEGVPNTVLEAMAQAVPVIATEHGGIPEAVVHEQTGILVQEHDDESLARALERMADDRELRGRWGEESRRHIEREFNAETQGGKLAALVREMAEGYRALASEERAGAWQEAGRPFKEPTRTQRKRSFALKWRARTWANRWQGRVE